MVLTGDTKFHLLLIYSILKERDIIGYLHFTHLYVFSSSPSEDGHAFSQMQRVCCDEMEFALKTCTRKGWAGTVQI